MHGPSTSSRWIRRWALSHRSSRRTTRSAAQRAHCSFWNITSPVMGMAQLEFQGAPGCASRWAGSAPMAVYIVSALAVVAALACVEGNLVVTYVCRESHRSSSRMYAAPVPAVSASLAPVAGTPHHFSRCTRHHGSGEIHDSSRGDSSTRAGGKLHQASAGGERSTCSRVSFIASALAAHAAPAQLCVHRTSPCCDRSTCAGGGVDHFSSRSGCSSCTW